MIAGSAKPITAISARNGRGKHEHHLQTEWRGGSHQGQPTGRNGERLMGWTAIEGISSKEERDNIALALFHAGYEVRQWKRKGGNRTVILIEYRKVLVS